jgi:hypothetical protein
MLVASGICGTAGALIMARSVWQHHWDDLVYALVILGAGFLLFIGQWITASRARCPLCTIPPLLRKGCQKNRQSKRVFGSYRMRVAMTVLLRGSFQCPYCGESTKLRVRDRSMGGIDRSMVEADSPNFR